MSATVRGEGAGAAPQGQCPRTPPLHSAGPRRTLPLAWECLSPFPAWPLPGPGDASGHSRPALSARPQSVRFSREELLARASSVREGALPT